jgi:hypothetical protein
LNAAVPEAAVGPCSSVLGPYPSPRRLRQLAKNCSLRLAQCRGRQLALVWLGGFVSMNVLDCQRDVVEAFEMMLLKMMLHLSTILSI